MLEEREEDVLELFDYNFDILAPLDVCSNRTESKNTVNINDSQEDEEYVFASRPSAASMPLSLSLSSSTCGI
jgi:hypothetical protein